MGKEEKAGAGLHERAGEILKAVKNEIMKEIRSGMKLLAVAETIESRIREMGGEPAFPANLCVGEVAAHFTPLTEEDGVVPDDSILKVDIGVHVDGYSADSAFSIYFGDDDDKKAMIEVAREAVSLAISKMKPGVDLWEIGAAVYDFVRERGYRTIENLNGHKIERWNLHGEKEIPTTKEAPSPGVVEAGEVYAVEVFVTDGDGRVRARDEFRIFSLPLERPKKIPIHVSVARKFFFYVHKRRRALPFTQRWFRGAFTEADIRVALAVLYNAGLLVRYPVLVEKEGASVAQAEETVLVTKEGVKVLT